MRLSSGRTQARTVLVSNFTLDFEPQKFLLPKRLPTALRLLYVNHFLSRFFWQSSELLKLIHPGNNYVF